MKQKVSKTIIALLILSTFSYMLPLCLSENYTRTYLLLDHPDGTKQYKLNVVVPQSLYDYYVGQNHKQVSETDFPKFVTPHALKPIADKLWEIYRGDYESFANGVLMIVHQIPYQVTVPAKYPVETIVENQGDCDLFSYVAASIMKAGGLNVVLLYYEDKAHMNVGVSLPNPPHYARTQVYYIDYGGSRYYIAECTGGNWRTGWRVGECPPDLIGENPMVITLENCEQWSPGQVSASYTTLISSKLSLTASSTFVMQGDTITLFGQLKPNLPNENITIYVKVDNYPWTAHVTTTNPDGKFTYILRLNEAGTCYIRASWSGNDDYAGTDSPTITVTVLPVYFVVFSVIVVALACVGVVIFLASRQKCHEIEIQKLPEISP
ncbi:Ig-like domain repeat protein [Candidatus Bathyarchaeota archaeon]|nr:Ig-like domain repeat protein [Candidatus Bathyarchaeota archaeon]MBS7637204.1 Ig-like domain repeat protein [Candidatus Bathyarchaeota archaeon]